MNSRTEGILATVIASFLFATMGVLTNAIANSIPALECAFYRGFICCLVLIPYMKLRGISLLGVSKRDLFLRGLCGFFGAWGIFYSAAHLIPGEAFALYKTSALFMPFVAYFILDERSSARRLTLSAMGFLGVILIMKPGTSEVSFAHGVALFAAFMSALSGAAIRHLSGTEHPCTIMLYFFGVSSTLGALFFGHTFVMPHGNEWFYMTLIATCGLLGQIAVTRAYSLVEATIVTPIGNADIVFASLLGWLMLGKIPDALSWYGAAVIVCAALLIARDRG